VTLTKSYTKIAATDNDDWIQALWVWRDGKLDVKPVYKEGPKNHFDTWGLSIEDYYRGRYLRYQNTVTIIPPYEWRFRKIPSGLMTVLDERWPGVKIESIAEYL
jgi:hypothetical protein